MVSSLLSPVSLMLLIKQLVEKKNRCFCCVLSKRSRSSVGRAVDLAQNRCRVVRGFESHRLHKKVPFFNGFTAIMQAGQPFRFHTPSSILVVGPSGCGKTVFTEKLLVDNPDLFETPPTQVHYCYGAWQDRFRGMHDRGVVFHEGIPDHSTLVQWFPQGQGVMVLDDLMEGDTINAC